VWRDLRHFQHSPGGTDRPQEISVLMVSRHKPEVLVPELICSVVIRHFMSSYRNCSVVIFVPVSVLVYGVEAGRFED
jgi:hypothetical protein